MSVLRTLVFGALVGVVGKKLYENGSLDRFAEDVKARYGEAKEKVEEARASRTTGSNAARKASTPRATRMSEAPSPLTPDPLARTN
ncbi:hypothetical protein [Sphingobium sp. CR28]|uniref:hypothetical protein n=1 Tax=Sphingobium sp. CR28 TaxID=3400272 RepID=UPI003FEEEA8C